MKPIPLFTPMLTSSRSTPFDDPDWIFELKHDGLRTLAYLEDGRCDLVSKRGVVFTRFRELRDHLVRDVTARNAVLDGEIVCFDAKGRSNFANLQQGDGTAYFLAFDLLWLNGRDWHGKPLLERKGRLKAVLRPNPTRTLYVEHVDGTGICLFKQACEWDLEGIVAKKKTSRYEPLRPSVWLKIKNPRYSQTKKRIEP